VKRKKVLLYYRYFGFTLGGGEYLPLTLVSELQKTCDVTLALDWTEHFGRAVSLLGIPVDLSRLEVVKVMPRGYRKTLNNVFESVVRFRNLRRLARKADVCISLANVMDFGRPAHHVLITQDLGDPGFDDFLAGRGRPPFSVRAKRFAIDRLLRPLLGMRTRKAIVTDPRERIYPNSEYVASLLRSYYGPFNGRTFLPPTLFEGRVEHPHRDPLAVLFVGRLAPAKRVAEAIGIVGKARELSGRDFKLRLAGKLDPGPYAEKLHALAATRPWVEFPGEVFGEAKTRFLFSGTYAIHARATEPFGISVTEYLKAGLVPVVADGGGAKEIVSSPALSFATEEEGARILSRLAEDADFREEQRRHCAKRAALFTKEAYERHQREVLAGILGEAPGEAISPGTAS